MRFSYVIPFIVVTRIVMLFFFKSGLFNTASIWNDRFHHYQLGVILLIILTTLHYAVSFSNNFAYSFALALIIEEYSVILYDLGINKGGIYYLGWIDTLILLILCVAIVFMQQTVLK